MSLVLLKVNHCLKGFNCHCCLFEGQALGFCKRPKDNIECNKCKTNQVDCQSGLNKDYYLNMSR